MKQEKLNTRQWNLYNFIKDSVLEIGGITLGYVNVKMICNAFPNEYHVIIRDGNYSNCPLIYKDIDVINESMEVGYIIIKDNNNFYIGTTEQAVAFKDKIYTRAVKLLAKYNNVCTKLKMDGQMVLISHKGDVIDEDSKAKPVFEAVKHEEIR